MLKKIILFLLIFSLPFQLGYHFWLPESYVRSFRIDYLAPTLYLTDIFILTFLLLNLTRVFIICKNFFTRPGGWLFLLLILINSYASSANPVTLLAWVRLGVYFLLLAVLASAPGFAQKVRLPFTLSLIFIICLSLIQFFRQSSLGGIFYLFGERPLSIALPNVAKLDLPWGQMLRPYATFSHPNSLAGYLLISLIILKQISRSKLLRLLVIATIFLTFSKSTIFTLLVMIIIKPNLTQSVLLALIVGFLPVLKLGASFSSRYYLFQPTIQIIKDHILLGTGLRQFIPTLAKYLPGNQISYSTLQPVHNLLLLIISEIGLIPTSVILLKTKHHLLNTKYSLLATILLITGSLDHYWWTLPQNQLIIVLALALIINSKVSSLYRRRGSSAIAER